MNTKHILSFQTILTQGSFMAAAQKLNYSQATITFHIRQLEEELNVKLFDKIGRKMMVTRAGLDLLPYFNKILDAEAHILSYATNSQEPSGTLKIAMPETLLACHMQPLLKKFKEEAPDVTLSLQVQNCYQVQKQVLNGEIDIGIHYDCIDRIDSLAALPIGGFGGMFVASPSLPEDMRDMRTPNQVKNVTLITDGLHSSIQDICDDYLAESHIQITNRMELWGLDNIKQSVLSNLGIAFLPFVVVDDEIEDGDLIHLPSPADDQTVTALCVYHKNKWISPAMQLFLDLLNESLYY